MSATTGNSRPSLRQVARMAGVSPTTVSRVFSENSSLVASETRERILSIAESCDFRPTALDRLAFGGPTNSVGIMVPTLAISYYAYITAGLQEKLLEADILPMILQTEIDEERRGVGRLLDHRVDALILILRDPTLNRRDFARVLQSNIPILLVDTQQQAVPCDTLLTDDIQGGFLAGHHLAELGHRRMAFCYYGEGQFACEPRLQGFRNALTQHGVPLPEECILRMAHGLPLDQTIQLFQEDLRLFLMREDRPTAIFAPTDFIALQVYEVAKAIGLRLPQDLSVVGYADLEFTPHIDPPLTTIKQDGIALGRRAGEILIERLCNPRAPYKSELLPTRLVVRQSTAPCGVVA